MISGSKSGHLEDQEASRITLRCMLDRELCVNERWIKVKCVMVAETQILSRTSTNYKTYPFSITCKPLRSDISLTFSILKPMLIKDSISHHI